LKADPQQQLLFRCDQLADLSTVADASSLDHARDSSQDDNLAAVRVRNEVRVLITLAARHALTDINRALDTIEDVHYGQCRHCQASIALPVLLAAPQTTLCHQYSSDTTADWHVTAALCGSALLITRRRGDLNREHKGGLDGGGGPSLPKRGHSSLSRQFGQHRVTCA
jgi:RNA polymerase-binding transcription factor DksA